MLALKSNAPEIKWIIHNAATSNFARSLDQRLLRTGDLSIGQLEAVRKILAQPAPVAAVQVAGVERAQVAFATAQGHGIKRPRLRLGDFVLKLATRGNNLGAIFVTEGEQYLGKIVAGKFHAVRECTQEKRDEIVELCSDPARAAVAYGQRTGTCACCGRELTDPESIERGIGPICAGHYGF